MRDLVSNPEMACLQPPASGRMVEALSKCSSEVPSPVDDNHSSRKEANLREFKGAMAAFLARQPKPQVQRQQAERIASVDPYHGLRPPPLRYRQTRPRLAGEPEPGAPLRRFQASRCSRRPPGRLAGHLQLAGRAQPPRHDLAQGGRRDASRRRRRRQRACGDGGAAQRCQAPSSAPRSSGPTAPSRWVSTPRRGPKDKATAEVALVTPGRAERLVEPGGIEPPSASHHRTVLHA